VTEPTTPVVLSARGIGRAYKMAQETIPVLAGLDLELRAGESVSVVGASGSGKTTMIQVLGLLDRPDTGDLALDGEELVSASRARTARVRNSSLGFIFQFYHLVPELSALENVLLPARIAAGFWAWPGRRADARDRARALLDQVEIGDRERHRPSQLSGGERQRVAIARALMNEPRVIFCDEPTGNLDPRTKGGVEELLLSVAGGDRAILLVTHDERFARRCDRLLRLKDGRLISADAEPADPGESS
jgi:lipoprotein-releasing system ATP-binding protein